MSRRTASPVEVVEGNIAWVRDCIPTVLAPGWDLRQERLDGRAYFNGLLGLAVIVSAAVEQDGRRWLHLSVSHRDRLPKWREVVEVKELFLGVDRYAYQVLPPRDRYINIHPNVLHLWHCLDGDPLPDFTHGGKSL